MIGIVVVTHGRLAEEMVRTVHGVLGTIPGLEAVSSSEDGPEVLRAAIRASLERVDEGQGVLILTDMLGDTATNLSLLVCRESPAEVVAGVNMPMLIKAVTCRPTMTLRDLASFIHGYGRDHIFWASDRRAAGSRR